MEKKFYSEENFIQTFSLAQLISAGMTEIKFHLLNKMLFYTLLVAAAPPSL